MKNYELGMKRDRYYIADSQLSSEPYRKALELAIDFVQRQDSPNTYDIVFITGSKTQYRNDLLKEVLGDLKPYWDGVSFEDFPGTMRLASMATYPKRAPTKAAVILIKASAAKVAMVEADYDAHCIIALPWETDDIEEWMSAHRPIDLETGERYVVEVVLDQQLLQHLDRLSVTLNLGHSTFGYDDEQTCKTSALAIVAYFGKNIGSSGIRAFLMGEKSWNIALTNQFVGYLETLTEGRRFRGGSKEQAGRLVEMWKAGS